jgi:ABC-2 type transport system permease protein
MAKLWAIIKREYLERVRTKWFLIATVFGPIFFGLIILLPAWLSIRQARATNVSNILILDATGTELGNRVRGIVSGGIAGDPSKTVLRQITLPELAAAESSATRAVMAKEVLGYLVLEPRTLTDTTVRYAGRNASSPTDAARIESAVRQGLMALRLEREGLDPQKVMALTRVRMRIQAEQISDRGRGGSGKVQFIFAAVVAFLLYTSILLYGQNVLRGVMEEKSTRVAEVVVSSVPTNTLLGGKVLGVCAVGITQLVIWMASSWAMVQLRGPIMAKMGMPNPTFALPEVSIGMLALLIVFFILGFTFYSSLYAAVGAMVNSEQEAQQAVQPLLFMVIASALMIQPVLINPNSQLAQVASWLPFSAPIIMPLRLSLVPVPAVEIIGTIIGSVIACVLAVWLASRIYRVGLLMYGKRPTLRELGRWIRHAH